MVPNDRIIATLDLDKSKRYTLEEFSSFIHDAAGIDEKYYKISFDTTQDWDYNDCTSSVKILLIEPRTKINPNLSWLTKHYQSVARKLRPLGRR